MTFSKKSLAEMAEYMEACALIARNGADIHNGSKDLREHADMVTAIASYLSYAAETTARYQIVVSPSHPAAGMPGVRVDRLRDIDCHFYPSETCPSGADECKRLGYCPRQHATLPGLHGPSAVDCFAAVNELIKPGDLGGDGTDQTAQRNGLILAANAIAALIHPSPEKSDSLMRCWRR